MHFALKNKKQNQLAERYPGTERFRFYCPITESNLDRNMDIKVCDSNINEHVFLCDEASYGTIIWNSRINMLAHVVAVSRSLQ